MRKRRTGVSSRHKILIVDDEVSVIDSLVVVLRKNSYRVTGVSDPVEAIRKLQQEHYDLLILDYLMEPLCGDQVVERIRAFNKDLYILIFTGHKELAPPLKMIKKLDVQGYCEKGSRFDQLILLVESGIKSIIQKQTIAKFKEGLDKILKAMLTIYQLQSMEEIIGRVLHALVNLGDYGDSFILVQDPVGTHMIYQGTGRYALGGQEWERIIPASKMERIEQARRTKTIVKSGTGLAFPLISGDSEAIGVLFVEGRKEDLDMRLLEVFVSQVAASIRNVSLHTLVHHKNEELNNNYKELKKRYIEIVEALRLAVDARDMYTRGHSERVAYYATKIGEELGLREKELELLKLGGIFHDIGKLSINDDVLYKNERLNDREFEEIKKHPLKGSHILSAVSMFKEVVPLVKYHHERVDGKGYPEGLAGDEIPFLARIISVADAFDSMTSDRLYRSKIGLKDAKHQLVAGAGTQFDEAVVHTFVKFLEGNRRMQEDIGCMRWDEWASTKDG